MFTQINSNGLVSPVPSYVVVKELEEKSDSISIPLDPLASRWMTALATSIPGCTIGDANITQIPILGSHNSATYGIQEHCELSRGAQKKIKNVYACFGGAARKRMCQWSKCQSLSVHEQLLRGVRYLDLRLCPEKKNLTLSYAATLTPVPTMLKNSLLEKNSTQSFEPHCCSEINIMNDFADFFEKTANISLSTSSDSTNTPVEIADPLPSPNTRSAATEDLWVTHSIISIPFSQVVREILEFYKDINSVYSSKKQNFKSKNKTVNEGCVLKCSVKKDETGFDASNYYAENLNSQNCYCTKDEENTKKNTSFLNSLSENTDNAENYVCNCEFIILDIQHLINFNDQHVKLLVDLLKPLAPLIVRQPFNLFTPLKELWSTSQRIFILLPAVVSTFQYGAVRANSKGCFDACERQRVSSQLQTLKDKDGLEISSISKKNYVIDSKETIETFEMLGIDERISCCDTNMSEDEPQNTCSLISDFKTSNLKSILGKNREKPDYVSFEEKNLLQYIVLREKCNIVSNWHNQRMESPIYSALRKELNLRACIELKNRRALHVFQGILTPWPRDIVMSIFSPSRARRILDFALAVNNKLLTIWEEHGKYCGELRFGLRNDDSPLMNAINKLKPSQISSNSTKEKCNSLRPVFDGRNILMLDYFQIGMTPSGLDSFRAVSWQPALRRFAWMIELETANSLAEEATRHSVTPYVLQPRGLNETQSVPFIRVKQ